MEILYGWIILRKYCSIIFGFLMSAGDNRGSSDVVLHGQEFLDTFREVLVLLL